jgi:hypothetical protein
MAGVKPLLRSFGEPIFFFFLPCTKLILFLLFLLLQSPSTDGIFFKYLNFHRYYRPFFVFFQMTRYRRHPQHIQDMSMLPTKYTSPFLSLLFRKNNSTEVLPLKQYCVSQQNTKLRTGCAAPICIASNLLRGRNHGSEICTKNKVWDNMRGSRINCDMRCDSTTCQRSRSCVHLLKSASLSALGASSTYNTLRDQSYGCAQHEAPHASSYPNQ